MAILSERLEYSAEAHGVGDPEVVIEVHGDVDLISAPGLSILIFEVAGGGQSGWYSTSLTWACSGRMA